MGDKCKIMRPQPQCGRNASRETNVKSCGPVMHPFQRSKNPSQVNLFGEERKKERKKTMSVTMRRTNDDGDDGDDVYDDGGDGDDE